MPAVTFPLEIKETILELLAEDDKGHLALKTCSLVCRAFLPISRKHIFESIVLDQRSPTTTYAFECLLRETPEIADYIRKLDYNIPSADLISSSFQESLKRISRLESLSVRHFNWEELDWSDDPIRPTLLHLLHLPTLTYFKIIGNNDFVISDLIPCVNLKYLDIGVHTTLIADNTFNSLAALPKHSIRLREFVRAGTNKNSCSRNSATILKLCSARRPDGQAIIDFGSLSKITVTLDDPIEGEALQELFSRCHALTNAHISFLDPQNVRLPRLSDMLRPSIQTLKNLVVNIHVLEDGDDSLLGIPSEFEDMRTKNIIETVTIRILVLMYSSYSIVGDDWVRLDEILTSPGWFSLKRVSLVIKLHRGHSELEEPLQKLFETQFPRLLSSNSVSLDIKVKSG